LSDIVGIQHLDFQAGDIIFEQGVLGEAAYMVVSGRVEITIVPKQGPAKSLGFLTKGKVFGELSMFDGYEHMATAVATEPSTVSAMSHQHFQMLVDNMDPVMKAIVLQMVKRARQTADNPPM
jgi:CRP-like cAMP-binding protein